jgi:hypothetical protein
MDLDDFIIAVFCQIDEVLPQITQGQRVRQRGPAPTLDDSEVLTMEVVGEYLLISAQGTKAVVDWQHGSTTEGRLARGAA